MKYTVEFEDGQFESIDDIPSISLSDIESVVTMGTDWTSETIISQILKGNINLDPEFQRREVWSVERKSKFIESLMIGIPVPQIVLAEDINQRGSYLVIDGKQRLLTLCQFTSDGTNEFKPFKLKGLEICSKLNNKTIDDISSSSEFGHYLRALDNATMRSVLVKNWQSEAVLYNIFLRLNSNSVQLSPQELRQALCPGPFVSFLDRVSGNSEGLRTLLNNEKPDYRMRDAEILLRHIGFELFAKNYKGNLKPFLDTTCRLLNKNWNTKEHELKTMVDEFESACDFLEKEIPKRDRFKKWNPETKKFSPQYNRAVFEIMVGSCLDRRIQEQLKGRGTEILSLFTRLCETDSSFFASLTSTTKSLDNTRYRFNTWYKELGRLVDLKIKKKFA